MIESDSTTSSVLIFQEHPEVVSVFPNKALKLHTTRSWDFMGLEHNSYVPSSSIWRKARFGEDSIIANLDTGFLLFSFKNYFLIVLNLLVQPLQLWEPWDRSRGRYAPSFKIKNYTISTWIWLALQEIYTYCIYLFIS